MGDTTDVADYDRRDKRATDALAALVGAAGSTLDELVSLSTKSAAELLVEAGDPRRFAKGRYARVNGTASIPASPVRATANQSGTG